MLFSLSYGHGAHDMQIKVRLELIYDIHCTVKFQLFNIKDILSIQ